MYISLVQKVQTSLSKPSKLVRWALGMLHPGEKLLSICESVKLENKLLTSQIKGWNRHRIIVIHILSQKGRRWKKQWNYQSQAFSESNRNNSIRFQGLGIILYGPWLQLLCPWPCLWVILFQKSNVYLELISFKNSMHIIRTCIHYKNANNQKCMMKDKILFVPPQ